MVNLKKLLVIIAAWNQADQDESTLAELQSYYADKNIQALSLEDLTSRTSFLPNSLVMTCEDDPRDSCFYTEDGIHLTPIVMIDANSQEEIDPKEVLTEEEAEDEGYEYYDFETFMDHFEGYENILLNFKITRVNSIKEGTVLRFDEFI